jgi:hypothetical protein
MLKLESSIGKITAANNCKKEWKEREIIIISSN